MNRTVRLILLSLLALFTFTAEPATAQRGRGFRSAPRISAPRTPGVSSPSTRSVFSRGPIPANSYRRYSSYRSSNGFANLFPWLFLWSATNNRAEAQEDEAEQAGGTADRVIGLNYGLIFTVVVVAILIYGAVMLFVGTRQRGT